MSVIEINHLTKDYGEGRGIFDINLSIEKGEVFGYVGTNASGKTTTIRHIMGFLQAQQGSATVMGFDAWKDSVEVKKFVSYIPGEIAFPDLRTGTEFLKAQAELLGLKNMDYANYLCDKLQLDTSANLKRMSKGMKQKTAIVAALMANKDILILDEPTTGLDPLMRETFLDIILEEKEKGKTIFMSSHMFDELEDTCDRVAMIQNGHIIDCVSMNDITNTPTKTYKIEFTNREDFVAFKHTRFKIIREQPQYNQVTITIKNEDIAKLMKSLTKYKLKFVAEIEYTLENHFKDVLKKIKEKESKNV